MTEQRTSDQQLSQPESEPSEMSKVLHELADEAAALDRRLVNALDRIAALEADRIDLLTMLGKAQAQLAALEQR